MESDHKVVAHNFDGYWRVSAQQCVQPRCQTASVCSLVLFGVFKHRIAGCALQQTVGLSLPVRSL